MGATTPAIVRQGALFIGGETTFGTEASNYDYVECTAIERNPEFPGIENTGIRQDFYSNSRIPGAKTGTLTTTHYIYGSSDTAPSAAPSHTTPDQSGATGFDQFLAMLAAAIGNIASGGYNGSIDFTGSTTSLLKGDDLSSFAAGQFVAWQKADGSYEGGWLKDLDTGATPDEANLLQTATAAPQGPKLWGSHTIYMAKGQPYLDGTPASFSLKWAGDASDDLFKAYGCAPIGLTFSFPKDEAATCQVTWGVAEFEESGSGGSPAVQTWSYPGTGALKGGLVVFGTDAGSTFPIMDLTVDLGLERTPIPDYNAPQGIGGWHTVNINPTVRFSTYRSVADEVTDFAAGTTAPFTATFGTPGKMFSVCMPTAQISEFPGFGDADGRVTAPVALEAAYHADDTGSAPAGTHFRFALA